MMKKSIRRIIYVFLSLGIVVFIGVVVANSVLKNKIAKYIESELPENMVGSYNDLSARILSGTISLSNPSFIIQNKEDRIKHTFITAKQLEISGISFWKFLMGNELYIENILLERPEIAYYQDRKSPIKDSIQQKELKLDRPIYVELFQIKNSTLSIYENGEDSTKFFTKDFSIEIGNIQLDNKILSNRIPIKYQTIEAKGDSIFFKANAYENLTVGNFSLENHNAIFNDLLFKTKYPKNEFSQKLDVERDHYDLILKTLSIDKLDFGFLDDELYVKSNKINLDTPSLFIFRDKLVADDLSIKPLYSKSLRELPFQLTVDSININNGYLQYDEKVNENNPGGSINFKNLNAKILNVSNTYKDSTKTDLNIQALFMEKTPISVVWSFDVQNTNDDFIFKADVGALKAEKLNSFTQPNLKVRLEGHVDRTYFTIDGNNTTSKTDMKINYSDFQINVLRKDGENKNKLISAVVNIFVSKDSERKDSVYKEASVDATRDKTKSVFNFLWISVKNALEKCVTGSSG